MLRALVTAALVVTALSSRAAAQATEASVSLSLRTPAECPDHDAIVARIRAATEATASLPTIAGEITRADEASPYVLRVALTLHGQRRNRSLTDASCVGLIDALVAIVSLAASEEEARVAAEAEQARTQARTPPEESPGAPADAGDPTTSPGWRLAPFLGAGVTRGAVPISPVLVGGASFDVGVLELALSARGTLSQRVTLDANPSAGGSFSLLGVRAAAGLGIDFGPHVRASWLVGLEMGRLVADSFGTTSHTTLHDLSLELVMGPRLRLSVFAPLALVLQASLGTIWNRRVFAIDDQLVAEQTRITFEATFALAYVIGSEINSPRNEQQAHTQR